MKKIFYLSVLLVFTLLPFLNSYAVIGMSTICFVAAYLYDRILPFFLLPLFYHVFINYLWSYDGYNMGSLLVVPLFWSLFALSFILSRQLKLDRILLRYFGSFFIILIISLFKDQDLFKIIHTLIYLYTAIPVYYFIKYKNIDSYYYFDILNKVVFLITVSLIVIGFIIGVPEYFDGGRLVGFTSNPNLLALLVAPFLLYTLFNIELDNKFISIIFIIVYGLVLLLTGSRSILLAILIGIFIFVIYSLSNREIRNLKYFFLFVVLIIPVVAFAAQAGFLERILSLIQRLETYSFSSHQINERVIIWPQYFDLFMQNPFWGFPLSKSFKVLGGMGDFVQYIDSTYINLLLYYGLIGSVIILIPMKYHLFRTSKTLITPQRRYFEISFILLLLIFGFFTSIQNEPAMIYLYMLTASNIK